MARTVLSAMPNRRATCRADALSQACPTASSNRWLKGALLGNWATFSARNPQRGHFIRYVSTTIVVEYSKHGRSRTSRSLISWIRLAGTCCPHPEQINFSPAFFRLTHSFSFFPGSSISFSYTWYHDQRHRAQPTPRVHRRFRRWPDARRIQQPPVRVPPPLQTTGRW